MSAIPHPYSQKDAEEWISLASNPTPQTHFAIAVDGEVVGGIGIQPASSNGLSVSAHTAEIGYWLGEPFWGRGIMSEVLTAMTQWAFNELPLVRLQANVYARNRASARILEKAGYQFEGRLRARFFRDGEYIDGLMYAVVKLPT